jgi:hypothetical protein
LGAGAEGIGGLRNGIVRVEPTAERPPDDVAECVDRFTKMYDQALRNLAERWANLDLRRVLFAHAVLVEQYGGSEGIRDLESLKAAIERPWGSSFGRQPTSPDLLRRLPPFARPSSDAVLSLMATRGPA